MRFLQDPVIQNKIANTQLLIDVCPLHYDALFYVGGRGSVLDLAIDPVNIKLAAIIWNPNKLIAAVCHGTAYVKAGHS